MTQNEYIFYDLIKCMNINMNYKFKKIIKIKLFKNNLVILCIDCKLITNKHEFPQQFLQ